MINNDNKKIIYLRSTEIFNDSRATKEINSYASKYNVLVLGWNRNSNNLKIKNKKNVKYQFFNKKAKYGSGIKNLLNIFKFNLWLIKQMKKNVNNFEIIHACDLDTAIAARYIAKKYKKKMIYDIYDYYVECHNLGFFKNFVEKIDIKIINNSDTVLICTEKRKKQISKSNPKRVEIIHNSPNIECETKKNKENNNRIANIGYFGILQDDRLLLEISKEIIKNKEFTLHIGGFGKYEEYFKELSQKYDNIKYYGQVSYEDVIKKEKEFDLLFATYNPLIPNHKYSAPNKVYEAMALNLPIIVCKGTGIDEMVENEKIGYTINYDASDFIKTAQKINKNDFKNNNKVFLEKYSWQIMEKNYLT